mmetsp:Transcript_69301/g.203417  ORF Transcript_69301/g.203417 Transcript_69301/m.203417 type:complete len:668 (-) Transcript_69301:151-2154(-)
MKGFAAVLLLLPLLASGARLSSKVTPTEKVIQMLTDMHGKGEKMMEEEQKVFREYTNWVDDQVTELGFEIKTATAKIEELIAFAEKADSDVATLGEAIETLDKDISTLETELKEAKAMRASEHAEYVKVSTDYGESVDALERAIEVMASQDHDTAQAESMLQSMATTVPGMPSVLNAFIQEKSRAAEPGAPEVAAYESQSGGIVEMLEGLLKKFKGELGDVQKAESNEKHAFEMEELHLSDTIEYSTSQREEKAITKGKRAAASAEAKGELSATKADKAADEELKAETEAVYKEKSAAFEENQKVRAAEIEALAKALEIMSGGAVAGAYKKRVNLAQTSETAAAAAPVQAQAFIQLRSTKRRVESKEQAAMFLRKAAVALKSKTLADFAEQVPANAFEKVIGMIEELVAKLKEEAAAEADHKAWCDEQLKVNKEKRNAKTSESNKLMAEIEAQSSTIATLGEEIETLAKEQQDLTTSMQEATKLREEEKTENTAIIADATAGNEAVQNALVVLKEFYSAQASFVQQQQAPEMAAYKGMQSGKGGVVGMLEVILSDFGRLKSETTVAEESAVREYDAFMSESTASKEVKHKREVQAKLEKDQTEFEKSESVKDLKAVDKELAKATEYYEYLKPSCIEVHVSYEERVAARKAEIQALKDAYGILDKKSQ